MVLARSSLHFLINHFSIRISLKGNLSKEEIPCLTAIKSFFLPILMSAVIMGKKLCISMQASSILNFNTELAVDENFAKQSKA